VRGKSTSLSQIASFDGTAMLLESNPSLYYRFSYLVQRTESSNQPSQQSGTFRTACRRPTGSARSFPEARASAG
jgi:hypothetical protein